MDPPSTYRSYILRLWKATHDGEPVWQASLQSTATGQRHGFADMESLFTYLTSPAVDESVTPDHNTELITDHLHQKRRNP